VKGQDRTSVQNEKKKKKRGGVGGKKGRRSLGKTNKTFANQELPRSKRCDHQKAARKEGAFRADVTRVG